jgi:hypothetical protein
MAAYSAKGSDCTLKRCIKLIITLPAFSLFLGNAAGQEFICASEEGVAFYPGEAVGRWKPALIKQSRKFV